MKKIFYWVLLALLFTGCKSWDATMIAAKKDPITPKLLTLDRRMEDMSNTTIVTNDDELKLFTNEVEDNLVDPYGDKYGYIAFKRNIIKDRMGVGFLIPSGILFYFPNIFGLPYCRIKYKVETELRIYDKENRLIGKYSGIGQAKVIVALYYGYSLGSARRKAYVDALNNAFSEIRPQIKADAERINEKLKATGKL